MVSVSRRLSLTSLGEILPIGILTISAIILALVVAGRDPGRAVHEAVMQNLRAVDVNHASLQRDVLRARAGLLPSYDALVHSVSNLRRTISELTELLKTPPFNDDDELHQLLTDLAKGIDSDEVLVEGFKTRNALLQNSISVFGQTLTTLHESDNEVVKRALARASDLGNLMMRFSTRPDESLQSLIQARLSHLPEFDTAAPVLKSFGTVIVHAKMILAVLPRVDSKIAAIQASPTPLRAEKLQSKYVSIAADASSRASTSRIMLGIIASFLSVYICVLVYRLRAQTTRLKRRLHYEQVIADIKDDMVDCCPSRFPDFMDRALARISTIFGAHRTSFAIYNPDRSELRDAHQFSDSSESRAILKDFTHNHIRQKGAPTFRFYDKTSCCHSMRLGSLFDVRDRNICHLVVGAEVGEHDIAVLVLALDNARAHFTTDEMHLLLATLKTFMEFIETIKGRQERDGLETRLQHAQRLEAVGTLAGGIAHEFNNVLGAILGYGEMAVQLLRKPSATRNYVEEILKSGARAKHIVDQILTFSRKRERIVKPFDVADAIADILPLLQVTLGNKVVLDWYLCQTSAVIEGNPVEIHQLVMNLCKNASQASARGQRVKIEVQTFDVARTKALSHGEIAPGAYVCLSVKDEGPGIPDHVMPHIFEPFFTTNSSSGGSGLGLSAVHGIVSALGGCINVESESAKGTEFSLYFPSTAKAPLPIDSFFNERAVPTGNGEQVIIVEEDKMLRELYEEKVAALGYEPIGYTDMVGLRRELDRGMRADVAIFNQKCVIAKADLGHIETVFGQGRMLLLGDRTLELTPELSHLRSRILKTPFSSASLANAIFDSLTRSI